MVSATPFIPTEHCPSAPQFWGFVPIYYAHMYGLTYNDQILHGSTKVCFRESAMPLHIAEMLDTVCQRQLCFVCVVAAKNYCACRSVAVNGETFLKL